MAKTTDKNIKAAAEITESRGELKQVKIFLPANDIDHLNRIAAREGIKGTLKARLIIIRYLDSLKESDK